MINKLGYQIDCNNEYGGQFEALGASPPPALVAMINPNDPYKAAPFLGNVPYLVARYKSTGRGEDAMSGTDGLDPRNNSTRAYNAYSPLLPAYPKAYWMYYRNEISDWSLWDKYAEEMVTWIEILASRGYKAAVGGFSVGTPDYPIWGTLGMAKVLDACERYGALLNIHEYGLNGNITTDSPHHVLRYRQPAAKNVLAQYPQAKIFIGELGLDGDTNTGAGGAWTQVGITPEQYLAQLRWYNAEIVKDAQVVGAAVFQWHRNGGRWNVEGVVAQGILADIRASTPTQPAPEPQPVPTPSGYPFEGITTRGLNARLGTSLAGYLLKLLPAGTRVRVTGESGDRVVIEASILKDGVRRV